MARSGGRGARSEDGDALASAQLQGSFCGGVVYQNFLVGDDFLHAGAADVEVRGKELV